MALNLLKCLSLILFLALLLTSFALVFNGPIEAYFSGKTEFIEKYKSKEDLDEPIKWPSLAICKSPTQKSVEVWNEFISKLINESFSNEAEFYKMLQATYYTLPEELVVAMSISKNFVSSVTAKGKVPLQEPYIKNVLGDFTASGYCSLISLESLKSHLISEGEMSENDMDSAFTLSVWLQVA